MLIATELMARGLDFKGVNLVINYDFPQTVASYIHRIGNPMTSLFFPFFRCDVFHEELIWMMMDK